MHNGGFEEAHAFQQHCWYNCRMVFTSILPRCPFALTLSNYSLICSKVLTSFRATFAHSFFVEHCANSSVFETACCQTERRLNRNPFYAHRYRWNDDTWRCMVASTRGHRANASWKPSSSHTIGGRTAFKHPTTACKFDATCSKAASAPDDRRLIVLARFAAAIVLAARRASPGRSDAIGGDCCAEHHQLVHRREARITSSKRSVI
jgi:hypothetical protein